MKIRTLLKVASAAFFFACPALAQNAGTVTNHAFALGKGPGVTGYTSLLCASAQLAVGQAAADPICQTISGDVTLSAGGVTAIGANKVANAQFRQSGALSLVGRSANSTGNVADISATPASSCVFLESSSTLTCSLIGTSNLSASAVTYAKMQNVTAARLLGNPTGGAAAPSEISLGATLTFSGTALQTLAMTGDVTSSANSFATTIAANAVTNAKLATMATNTVKGNATAGSAVPTDLAVPSCSTASSALTWTTNTGFGCNSIAGAGTTVNITPAVRLTLTQGTSVTTSDVTGAPSLFLEPYGGGYQIQIYDGVSAWSTIPVAASTYSLPATQTQTCTLASSVNVTACTDTSQMTVGEQVTGTNIPGSTTIAAIPTSTTLTLSAAATGSGATSLTFKLPPSTNYDIYAQNNGGVPKMVWSAAWSTDTTPPTRALQNGIWVQSGTTTNRLLGSVRTTTIAGQLEDSRTKSYVSNLYNAQPRPLKVAETTDSWPYTSLGWRQANGSTANQVDVLFTVAAPIFLSTRHMFSVSTGTATNAWTGIGVDSTSVSSNTLSIGGSTGAAGSIVNLAAEYAGSPGMGRHYFPWLEYGAANATFYGDAGTNGDGRAQSGLIGAVAN